MTPPGPDPLTAEIEVARFRTAIERTRNAALRQLGEAPVTEPTASIAHLKHLAQKSRDRIERVVARAEQSDQRGDASETKAMATLDHHDQFWDGVDGHIDGVDDFTHDMENQLGNEPKASVNGANGSDSSSTGSEQK